MRTEDVTFLRPEDKYVARTCSMCGCTFHDSTRSYCRVCTNQYGAWKYHQRKAGLPTAVAEYRRVMNKPTLVRRPTVAAAPVQDRLKECPVCGELHRNPHSGYCAPCHSAYQTWARKRRATRRPDGTFLTATMAEFRHAYDQGIVKPRKPGETGPVVRGL